MSVEQLAERVGGLTDRHAFMQKAGAATLGALAGFMGFPRNAAAYTYHCCVLCKPNDPYCPTRQYVRSCWGWNCCYNGDHHHCYECYGAGTACTGYCGGVVCSYVYHPPGGCHPGRGGSCG
jgi:hypothetical protein